MANKKLNQTEVRYRLFAEKYVELSYNGTAAYLEVYDTKNYTSAGVSASRLLKNEKVQQYIKDFENQPIRNPLSKEEIVNNLIELRDEARAKKKYSDAIKVNDILLKTMGYNEAEKFELGGTIKFDFGDELEDGTEK